MFWLLTISIVLLLCFVAFKLWEIKKGRVSWLSRTLSSQDERVRSFFIFLIRKGHEINKGVRIFIFSQFPSACFLLLEKAVSKASGHYDRLRSYIRGRLKIKKDRPHTSHFLKEIAKVKEERINKREPE